MSLSGGLTGDDYRKMTELQRAISEVINRANREKLATHYQAYFATLRLCRELLRMFPEGDGQAMMLGLGIDFLRGEPGPDDTKLIRLH